MSEELENSVREMLKEETWTRAAISNFTKNNLIELTEVLDKARAEGCGDKIKEICDEQLTRTKDTSIVALYLSGMLAFRDRSLDNSALVTLVDIFENNHKEPLIEFLCESMLEEDATNKFALHKLADFYKATNDDRIWEAYEKIVKVDFEEADIAKILAERYESQGNSEAAVSYYKKALHRYVAAKNNNAVKEMWSKLISLIPEEIDFFLSMQRKIAKTISEDKSSLLLQELYTYYKDTAKWDIAIEILKIILNIDPKDGWARREITDCYRGKYANHSHLENYILLSQLNGTGRSIFDAISDFEKHISFDAKSYVFHRSWGVGIIRKVEGDMLTINFGKKNGIHEMSLKMAVSALQPLAKDHIWVLKATQKKEDLAKKVKSDVTWTLKTVIKSFENNCDDKRIKAELVPSILTAGEWTSWHAKAQKVLASDSTFGVNPNDINIYTVRDRKIDIEERLNNEFKAEKQFFSRLDILMRYANDDEADKNNEFFTDMFSYFTSYLKAFTNLDEQVVASYLAVQRISRMIPSYQVKLDFTFAQLYGEIEKPNEMYTLLKDTKNTSLKEDFIANIKQLPNWDTEYVKLFPTVLKTDMIHALLSSGKNALVTKLVQDCFNEYRPNRDAAIFLFKECRNEEWYKAANISYEKQLVTLVNIIALCYREINNHVNSTDNKKTIKNATTLLFAEKGENGELKNNMLSYMLDNDRDTITRMYTMVNDVKDLDSTYKAQLRNGILAVHSDFKFQEAETKQEAPKGLLVTAKMLEIKKQDADRIETVELPAVAVEVSDARAKGDLKENAEYSSAKEKQSRLNVTLRKLKEEINRAVIFDPTTVATSMISFGTTVTLVNNIENKDVEYTILGPWESNADEGIISYLSPLGNNLLDSKVGDSLKFTINDHPYDFTVKAIRAAKM